MPTTRIPEIDKLYEDVREYQASINFQELISFVCKFPHIAPYNAMLIHIQKPGSTYVASVRDWYAKFGRKIKPGARPLIILKPFGPVSFVYEYNDTEGKPLPKDLVEPFRTENAISKADLNALISNIKSDGVGVEYSDFGSSLGAFIKWHSQYRVLQMRVTNSIRKVKSYHSIVVNSNLSDTERYAAILHELGHMYCGHLYHDHSKEKWLPERFDIGLSYEQKEFEAETVCYMVCERMGIKNPSIEYLSGYLDSNNKIPDISVDSIMKATGIIENLIHYVQYPRKELLIKEN